MISVPLSHRCFSPSLFPSLQGQCACPWVRVKQNRTPGEPGTCSGPDLCSPLPLGALSSSVSPTSFLPSAAQTPAPHGPQQVQMRERLAEALPRAPEQVKSCELETTPPPGSAHCPSGHAPPCPAARTGPAASLNWL